MNVEAAADAWSPARRVAFRVGVIYLGLYALLNGNTSTLPLALVATQGHVPESYLRATNAVWSAVGHAFGVRGTIRAFDNGDTVGDHVALLCFALLALAGGVGWSLLDRSRREYRRELELVRVAVRAVLGLTVFAYAVFKVFPAQFSIPPPSRLVQTVGSSSRMGLLWTFMGASTGYQMFAGFAELAGCTLLIFRRTTVLGALVLFAVLTNVLVMDVAYVVPAKLCVLHLLAMAAFLLAGSAGRLAAFFVLNRPVASADLGPPPTRRRVLAKLAFLALVVTFEAVPAARYYFTVRDGSALPDVYGVYEVDEMRRAGEMVPPLLTDPGYWHLVAVERRRAVVTMADGSRTTFAQGSLSIDRTPDDHLLITSSALDLIVRAHRAPDQETLLRQPLAWFNSD